jgi:hypothetical protein
MALLSHWDGELARQFSKTTLSSDMRAMKLDFDGEEQMVSDTLNEDEDRRTRRKTARIGRIERPAGRRIRRRASYTSCVIAPAAIERHQRQHVSKSQYSSTWRLQLGVKAVYVDKTTRIVEVWKSSIGSGGGRNDATGCKLIIERLMRRWRRA